MLRRITTVACALAFFGAGTPEPAVADGNTLLTACQAQVRVTDDRENIVINDFFQAGLCIGYLSGVRQMVDMIREAAPMTMCVPTEVEASQLSHVLVKCLTEHPEDLHLHQLTLTLTALTDAFPCDEGE